MDNSLAWLGDRVARAEQWLGPLNTVADGLIAVALLVLAVVLLTLTGRRVGRARDGVLKLFLVLAFTLGLLFCARFLGQWLPTGSAESVLKGAVALLAVAALIGLVWSLPDLIRRPSRERLQSEVAAHLKKLEELRATRASLEARMEARTSELAETKQRFEMALRGLPISVFNQDKALRFTWAHNLPEDLALEDVVGKTDADILEPAAAEPIMAAKRAAMDTRTSQNLETTFELGGRERAFYFVIEPLQDEAGEVAGTASVAVDISERKASEQQLRGLLRELTHRSKNLLAVIHAIARQTASGTTTIEEFLDRFGARLYAIGMSHDLLVADDWQGASLRMLVEQQLETHLDTGDRIAIDGEDVVLKPEAVHNLGLALHELTANAEKFGSLSNSEGAIRIRWNYSEDAETLKLVWEESGGPEVHAPSYSGFGRAMIERVVSKALAGDVNLSFPVEGVTCEIVIPAAHITSRG